MVWWLLFFLLNVGATIAQTRFIPARQRAYYMKGARHTPLFMLAQCLVWSISITAAIQAYCDPSEMPVEMRILGACLVIVGQTLTILAFRENPYFTPAFVRPLRIIKTGIYKHLRHPGYGGMACTALGYWFLLGQQWALAPTSLYIGLLIWQTYRETKLLYR